jgi:endo-1,4-beta-mannosidase
VSEPFRLGVNYWPRRKAVFWWSDFDREEVRQDFALLRELGLHTVRIFPLWDDFQPDPRSVSAAALRDLVTVADLAADFSLGLDVTFFTGHMSGPNWAPRWLLDGPLPHHPWIQGVVSAGKLTDRGYRNMFHDPLALDAEELLLRETVGALHDHPGVWIWSLGNEPDLFAWPESAAAGRDWIRRMTGQIQAIDDRHPVTCGLHGASLSEDNGLRVDQVFAETDLAAMHSYAIYSDIARTPTDPDYAPFCVALTASLCGKPVFMEEFGSSTAAPGGPSEWIRWTSLGMERREFRMAEEELAEYLRQTLPRLVDVGALGAQVWCFADYVESLWDRPPCKEAVHERFFGLVRADGSLKPHALVLKEFAAARPQVRPIPEYARLHVDADAYYRAPHEMQRSAYREYLSRLPS